MLRWVREGTLTGSRPVTPDARPCVRRSFRAAAVGDLASWIGDNGNDLRVSCYTVRGDAAGRLLPRRLTESSARGRVLDLDKRDFDRGIVPTWRSQLHS